MEQVVICFAIPYFTLFYYILLWPLCSCTKKNAENLSPGFRLHQTHSVFQSSDSTVAAVGRQSQCAGQEVLKCPWRCPLSPQCLVRNPTTQTIAQTWSYKNAKQKPARIRRFLSLSFLLNLLRGTVHFQTSQARARAAKVLSSAHVGIPIVCLDWNTHRIDILHAAAMPGVRFPGTAHGVKINEISP